MADLKRPHDEVASFDLYGAGAAVSHELTPERTERIGIAFVHATCLKGQNILRSSLADYPVLLPGAFERDRG